MSTHTMEEILHQLGTIGNYETLWNTVKKGIIINNNLL